MPLLSWWRRRRLRMKRHSLVAQIQHGETLLREHRARVIMLWGELRKVDQQLMMTGKPHHEIKRSLHEQSLSH